jgi:hypothetical protein
MFNERFVKNVLNESNYQTNPERIYIFNLKKIYSFQFFISQVLLVNLAKSWKPLIKLYFPLRKTYLDKHIQYMFICIHFHIFLVLISLCSNKQQ